MGVGWVVLSVLIGWVDFIINIIENWRYFIVDKFKSDC